ncbi:MAG: hypothetical protein HQK85_00790, partial [Nitrospinae bacterium]|nr:hypothetical protein [Nitrospinota bacterium]
ISDRNLHCIFRLGFAWDGFPIKGDRGAFNLSVLAGGEERELAKAAFKELWEIANGYAGFLYGFITWEDMLLFAWNRATKATDDMRRAYAQKLGYESKLGMIPTSDVAEFYDYIEFVDVKFSELFYDLKQAFPRLSAEVRVDSTPFNGLDGNPQQYIHNRQFVETDCDIIGTYFATYMVHGEPSAERAKFSMELAHRALLQAAPQKKIFIDQLLLVIKEKRFEHFPKLSEVELQKFTDWLPEWLDKYSCGYATWSFSDYLWDITFNGSFRYGFLGWTLEGSPFLVANQQQRYVELKHGDSIQGGRIEHFSPWLQDGVILVEAEIDEGSELRVELSSEIAISFDSAAFLKSPTNNGKVVFAEFTGQTEYIKVSLSGGNAKLYRIGVGKEIVSTGGYDINLDKSFFAYMMEGLNKKWGVNK